MVKSVIADSLGAMKFYISKEVTNKADVFPKKLPMLAIDALVAARKHEITIRSKNLRFVLVPSWFHSCAINAA
jgi:hypothetical protein